MLHCSLYKTPWPNIKGRKSLSSKWKPGDCLAGRRTSTHGCLFRTLFVDSSKLPPAKGAKRPATKSKFSLSFLKNDRPRIFNNATTRSVPTTPPLGTSTALSRPKSALPPTSAPVQPDRALARLEALRVPFIHLLAIRPVSEKFLAQTTGASVEECSGLLQKVGRPWRLDASKWELSDRAYKTLDIWKFHYASTDDRQMAIDNAVKAFDRQRLSRTDKLWDSLLPVKERNKGTCLSRLNLHSGFIQRSSTPRINVQQHQEGAVSGNSTSNESDSRNGALVPHGGEAMVRSRSQDPIKKTKISEREAQSKRLLSKDPKRGTLASKAKERKPAPKKDASTTNPRVKSAEFVRDSDEESSPMEGVVLTGGRSQPQRPAQEAKPAGSVTVPPRKKTTSTVPQKPSPLGCSPPTNASDFENEVGSSSSTTTATTTTTAATAATITSTTAAPSTTTTTTTTQRSQGPPLKRKADALGGNAEAVTNKRHQASSPAITPQASESSGGSRTPSQEVLLLARRFKSYYAKYERLYREVATSPSPPPEQVKKVMDMHNRLVAMKAEIERGAA